MKLIILSLLIITSIQNCQKKIFGESDNEENEKITQIVQDQLFKNGLSVRGHTTSQPEATGYLFPFGNNENTPVWSVAQWGSRNTLSNLSFTTQDDTIIYQNEAKRLYFHSENNGRIRLGLEVNASKEYLKPRQFGEDWVHLLLEQSFVDPIYLNDIEILSYNINAKLLFCDDKMNEDYNPDLHTAQITLFITIQNKNKNSPNEDDFFWFGLPLYDYRYKHIPEYAAEDLGKDDASRKFIYTVASSQLFQNSMHSMEWISIDEDIYPLIKNAFITAQSKGYMKNCAWDDLCITTMNVGWEVPGTFDCGILFDTPSLTAVLN